MIWREVNSIRKNKEQVYQFIKNWNEKVMNDKEELRSRHRKELSFKGDKETELRCLGSGVRGDKLTVPVRKKCGDTKGNENLENGL